MEATLPAAIDSETQVVGSLLIDPPRIRAVAKLLRPTDFADPYHRTTFDVLTSMDRAGEPIDVVTVRHRLATWELFRGGYDPVSYLTGIGQADVYAPNVERHAEIVAAAAKKRRLYDVASNAADRARNGEAPDSILTDLWSGVEDLRREGDPSAREIASFPLCEFINQDHRIECLVDGLIPARMGGLIAAKSKGQKTTIECGIDFALATGTPALGRFHVPRAVNCGIMSGESGAATLSETFQRIAAASDIDIRDVRNLHVSTEVPPLLTAEGLDSVERFIERHSLESLGIDPSYLAFAGVDDTQLSKMGEVLAPLNGIMERTGCGIRIVVHNRKSTPAPYGEPTLEEIGGTGLAQWARYWILLNKRREWDPNEGKHWLWFSSGSSAGFGHRYYLDVTEGRRSDAGGRVWQLEFSDPSEAQQRERDEAAASKDAAKLEGERRAVCNAVAPFPDGVSWSKALRAANVSSRRWEVVKEVMLDEGDVVPCEITVSNHKKAQPGIKLATAGAA